MFGYGYDNRNRLVSAQDTTTSGVQMQATYVYDALGQRIEKDVWTRSAGGTTTRFAYDGGEIWADLSSTNTLQTRYVRGDRVLEMLARIVSGTAAWFLADRMGSVRNVMDNTGAVIDTITYDGYGNITSETSPANGGKYKYDGYRLDAETGLLRPDPTKGRYYSPTIGRWMNEDPIGFDAQDMNLWRYARNNPTNLTDYSGLATVRVAVNDGASTRRWGFSVAYNLRETVSEGKLQIDAPGTVVITGTLASFTATQLQASGYITEAKIKAKGSFTFKKDQQYLVYIEKLEAPTKHKGTIKKYAGGEWVTVEGQEYYRTSVKFNIYQRTKGSTSCSLSVSLVKGESVVGVDFTGGVQLEATGTVEIVIVPGHKSSYAKITIAGKDSGTEKGTGLADGSWHFPLRDGKEYKDIIVKPTLIKESKPETKWDFKWENAP